LRDGNGALVQSDDNWKETRQTEIEATGLQSSNDQDSAVFEMLTPGAYTRVSHSASKSDTVGATLAQFDFGWMKDRRLHFEA
jgi:hypothetical protein